MLRIAGEWIITIIVGRAAWPVWPRAHLRRRVFSKATLHLTQDKENSCEILS